ncbi:Ger(x)C family spore germination protein [Alicyclobacillus ferrooxydans]|uniref:Uncharacterized protein n=1 Tax=Alicyclobacillus ferrooxydans TaxID=471514 RepID=A0A0P9CL17_9BACL|nr:Ger(x)C family spore germination protein [Alicyclobacillus ferrooxydans]KPV43703.1 hypothetical protein AN477_11120 [Alicyclobacillus ferrooxydans]
MKHVLVKTRAILLVLLLTLPLITGCWDRVEIEQRATVLGLGIDVPDDGVSHSPLDVTHPPGQDKVQPKVLLTAHIAVPGRIPLGPGGGDGGGGGGSGEKAVWTVQAAGEDISDALTNMQQQVAERIFLGHLRIIVVSEAYARKGLRTIDDYFRRDPQIRRTTWLAVSKGKAADVMNMSPPLERVPTLYLLATMDRAKDSGKLPNAFVGRFWTLESSDGQEGFLPYVSIKQENNLKIDGLAYFQQDRMVGATTPFQIVPFMEIAGENPAGYSIPLTVDGKTVVVTAFRRLARIHTDVVNGQPVARVVMHVDTNLSEKDSESLNLQDPKTIADIRQAIKSNLEQGCLQLIQQTQATHSDIFGFGESFRGTHPGYWKRTIKSKQGWERVYPTLKVQLETTSRVHRMGMKDK